MSKLIPLGKSGKYTIVDDDVYEMASRYKWSVLRQPRKHCPEVYYAYTTVTLGYVGGKRLQASMLLHRLILHPPKGMDTDHKNHNGLDNKLQNIRVCTRKQNNHNQVRGHGRSLYKGVSRNRKAKCWVAWICHNRRNIFLGNYPTEILAAVAYDKRALELFGEYACLNIPTKTT